MGIIWLRFTLYIVLEYGEYNNNGLFKCNQMVWIFEFISKIDSFLLFKLIFPKSEKLLRRKCD